MPDDSPIPGRDAEEMALHSPVLSTVKYGGAGEGLSVLEPATRETVRQHQALGYKTPDQIYRR